MKLLLLTISRKSIASFLFVRLLYYLHDNAISLIPAQSYIRTRHHTPVRPRLLTLSRRYGLCLYFPLLISQPAPFQAESEVTDKAKREELDAVIKQARTLVLKRLTPPLPASTPDNDPALRGLVPPFKVQVRAQSRELLIEEEVRRRKAIKMNLANEGLEARKKDEEIASKKRKVEEDKHWEGQFRIILLCCSGLKGSRRGEGTASRQLARLCKGQEKEKGQDRDPWIIYPHCLEANNDILIIYRRWKFPTTRRTSSDKTSCLSAYRALTTSRSCHSCSSGFSAFPIGSKV